MARGPRSTEGESVERSGPGAVLSNTYKIKLRARWQGPLPAVLAHEPLTTRTRVPPAFRITHPCRRTSMECVVRRNPSDQVIAHVLFALGGSMVGRVDVNIAHQRFEYTAHSIKGFTSLHSKICWRPIQESRLSGNA